MLALACLPGFFDNPWREAVVAGGLLVLVWVRTVRVPGLVQRAAGVLAGASLFVYLVQWQVYPHFQRTVPLLGLVLSVLAGLAYQRGWEQLRAAALAGAREVRRRLPDRATRPARPLTSAAPVVTVCGSSDDAEDALDRQVAGGYTASLRCLPSDTRSGRMPGVAGRGRAHA